MKTYRAAWAGLIMTAMGAGVLPAQQQTEYPLEGNAQPRGALSGATIFLSPGHGWWKPNDQWVTQRGNWHGVVEDISNGETVFQYLVPYLWNAGANVVTVRERDLQINMVIVDAGDAGTFTSGEWQRETAESTHGGDHYVAKTATGKPTATMTFVPNIPEAGYYAVYAWYRPALEGETATKARLTIRHTGGDTLWVQDLNRDDRTWKYIGHYYFEAGSNIQSGAVVIDNVSDREGLAVTADAIRFGGGMGDTEVGGTTSGHPRWQESGFYYTKFLGFDPGEDDSRSYNQVHAMPRFAEYEAEPWEKDRAVYLSWHTNGSGDHKSTGISTYIYSVNAWGPPWDFMGYPGGDRLAHYVHNEVLDDVRAGWDAEWEDVGIITRWLGETNPHSNFKMPAALLENGYHDNAQDAAYILDPRFRKLSSKATYQGLVCYFANEVEGFDIETLAPEPPTHLRVKTLSPGKVEIAWNPSPADKGDGLLGDAPTSYRVFRSSNGKGFDNGTPVKDTRLVVEGLSAGETVYFRVTGENEGGRSWPTETLGVSVPANNSVSRVLVVNGFDRLDDEMNVDDSTTLSGTTFKRGILDWMNTRDYAIQHAEALEAAGYAVDSCANEAIAEGLVDLQWYSAVVWILGQEMGDFLVFDPAEQQAISAFLDSGRSLMLSGSEAAFGLQGTEFLESALHARFSQLASGAGSAEPVSGGIFDGMEAIAFNTGTELTYPVTRPDALEPVKGAIPVLAYPNGDVAALQVDTDCRIVFFGFPFETITDEATRAEVMKRTVRFLLREG